MQESVASSLAAWESFYVIIGSSAAALTGLQFVVVTLVVQARRAATTLEIDAYSTPTIVHFCSVLLVSAVLSAPWHALSSAALVLGAGGVLGVGYVLLVTRRARRTRYRPVLEDWIWHVGLPFLAYAILLAAAIALGRSATGALVMIAATALLLLFIGIHNAWDTVIYLALEQVAPREEREGK
ncbi:MAG: hypothetical protein ACJ79S_16765 [Gemmatimonadaceae bacterium]